MACRVRGVHGRSNILEMDIVITDGDIPMSEETSELRKCKVMGTVNAGYLR